MKNNEIKLKNEQVRLTDNDLLEYIKRVNKQNVDIKKVLTTEFSKLDIGAERILWKNIGNYLDDRNQKFLNQCNEFKYIISFDKKDDSIIQEHCNTHLHEYKIEEHDNKKDLFVKKLTDNDNVYFNICTIEFNNIKYFEEKYLTKELKKNYKIMRAKRKIGISYYLKLK